MKKEDEMKVRNFFGFLIVSLLAAVLVTGVPDQVSARNYAKAKYDTNRWQKMKKDYLKKGADRLIFVKYTGGTDAEVEMWKRVAGNVQEDGTTGADTWKLVLSTPGFVGQNGINKKKEGDRKTPTGVFHVTMAFGRKKSPGTAGISYTKLNKYHYWSGERATYNTFVDVRTLGRRSVAGEHLINYNPQYNYAMAFDFNAAGVYKKGSAIFLHCTKTGRNFTAGCVAVPQKYMKKIVKNTTEKTWIFIYKK